MREVMRQARYWYDHPPIHVLAAMYLGYKVAPAIGQMPRTGDARILAKGLQLTGFQGQKRSKKDLPAFIRNRKKGN